MFVIKRGRKARVMSDLETFLVLNGTEPAKFLAREVQAWGEFSYSDLEAAILDGRLNDLIDWQARYAEVVNEVLNPLWLKALAEASRKASRGKIILSDSEDWVKAWLNFRGGELITNLTAESKKAVANVLLKWQAEKLNPAVMAQQIRPLIGLNERQVLANAAYREKLYNKLLEKLPPSKAALRADQAAVRYASKQHRYRAETIVHTELAFAYNRGAHEGITRSIKAGYMNRCAMIWSTAGVIRTCGRCLELNGKVIGYTDETGVTLPPLHPRCRCAIMYREVKGEEKKPRGLAAGNIDTKTSEGSPPKLIERIEFTPAVIQKTLEHYEARIVNAPVEHAIIITRSGAVYHCNGDAHGIPKNYFEQIRRELEGAHVTHNHPRGAKENDNTFSNDDFDNFIYFKMARLRGIDEKFLYELNRNAKDNELAGHSLIKIYSLGLDFSDYHYAIMLKALAESLGYWRRER
mgnify:CR=1 FL=1